MNTLKDWVNESPSNKKLFEQEGLILDVTEQIWEKLSELGWKKQDLAIALGCGKSHVTQLLNGGRNMTLRTLSDIAQALDCDVRVNFVEKGLAVNSWQDIQSSIKPWKKAHMIHSVTAANDQWLEIATA